MNDYRIKLSYTSGAYQERYTDAIFGDGLSVDYNRQSNEQYYTEQLNGKITFVNDDYDFIMNAPFDQRIDMVLENYEYGSWWPYLQCYFYRTDCEINADDKIIVVQPTTADKYAEFAGVLEKEVDLIKLAPRITPVMLDKRPCLQLYALGKDSISCILSNMSWEQDCESVDDDNELRNTFHFEKWGNYVTAGIVGNNLPAAAPKFYSKALDTSESITNFSITSGQYTLAVSTYTAPGGALRVLVAISLSGTQQWSGTMLASEWGMPMTMNLTGSNGNPNCKIEFDNLEVYGRLISDVDSILGVDTFDIPSNDLMGNNRNYKKVSPVVPGGDLQLAINGNFSTTPTEWGIYQTGQYYTTPVVIGGGEFHPVLRNNWGRASYWVMQSTALDYVEQTGRHTVTLQDAYRLTDVINAILAELMPSLSLNSTFLGGSDPLDQTDPDEGILYITPKSNILNINYTEPAQTAPITLRQILDMLRVCYRCYWQLSASNLQIEHIEWFRRGGRYTGTPLAQIDLTSKVTVRNGKYWDYLTNKYTFDKAQMPARYEFGWMDEVTLPFMGLPIDMVSNYVDQSKVDKFTINNFDSDIDYLMLNPSGVSKNGFVILKADAMNILTEPIRISGRDDRVVLLTYSSIAGESVDVEYKNVGTDAVICAYNANRQRIQQIDTLTFDGDWTTTWELPAGTAYIVLEFGDTMRTEFTLNSFTPAANKVLYTNWNYNGYTDHWLQNGRLSFVYLSRYYAYDMPCFTYRIGTGQYAQTQIAKGIAKNKIQDVTFPTPGYIETSQTIRTGMGNGKIKKLTLNLSSKMAQATLEYDTE